MASISLSTGSFANPSATEVDKGDSFQAVAFVIGGQSYSIDIMLVREIRNWTGATALPNTADYVLGVINLRGVIVPIIDLKARFGLGKSEPAPSHVVVIVAHGGKLHGLLVDSVSDIVTCKNSEISKIPDVLGQAQNPLLSGIITLGDQMIAIVQLGPLLLGEHAAANVGAAA